jgi:hypothetical protein
VPGLGGPAKRSFEVDSQDRRHDRTRHAEYRAGLTRVANQLFRPVGPDGGLKQLPLTGSGCLERQTLCERREWLEYPRANHRDFLSTRWH